MGNENTVVNFHDEIKKKNKKNLEIGLSSFIWQNLWQDLRKNTSPNNSQHTQTLIYYSVYLMLFRHF